MSSLFRLRKAALLCSCLICLAGTPVVAQTLEPEKGPVDFVADNLVHDDQTQTVTATGNVEMVQGGRTLKADKVIYNLTTDKAKAVGNVVLTEANGDVHRADELELSRQMTEGYVDHVYSTLEDGSRLWADRGVREDGNVTTLTEAAYTPCEACETNPDAEPVWQIRASEVVHNKEEQRIVYRNATFDVFGVPVFWTPYVSHADGTVKQKSGLLTPSFGYSSDLGLQISNSYYYAIDPHRDATIGVTAMTDQLPLVFGEYRHRFNNAYLEMSGGATYSSRTEDVGGEDVEQDDEARGHLIVDGLWNINEKWRAGIGLEIASDDQYMRQYDFSDDDVLENQIYVERFSGRNYAVGRLLSFQDIRIREEQRDQPNVLPEMQVSMLGEPGQMLGGRWSADLSVLNLHREGSGQDMDRIVAELGWQRRLTSDTGLLTTVDLKLRGDGYYTSDRDIADTEPGRSNEGKETRGFASAHIVTTYPVAKDFERSQLVIAPEAALTVSPNISSESSNIPNEDSQDVQLDASNLFSSDRFPGYDRIEDGSHATYGVRTGVYGYDGSKGEVFLGQSYRLDDNTTPFPEGSGLSEDTSDLVGQVIASYKDMMDVNYRFQLDQDDMSSRRHEVDAIAYLGAITLGSQYLYTKAIEGAELSEDREQIRGALAYRFSEEWQARTGILYDMSNDEEKGMREAIFGLDYLGQCFTLSSTLERNLTRDSSGESGTEIMFRIGLKQIGEFSTSGVNLSSSSDDDDD